MNHNLEVWAAILVFLSVAGAIVYTFSHSQDVRVWTGAAWAAFVGGFIEGLPAGVPGGAGLGIIDGQAHADLGLRHLAIEALHLFAVPFLTGVAELRSFNKANPYPNPLATPTKPAQVVPPSPLSPPPPAAPPSLPALEVKS